MPRLPTDKNRFVDKFIVILAVIAVAGMLGFTFIVEEKRKKDRMAEISATLPVEFKNNVADEEYSINRIKNLIAKQPYMAKINSLSAEQKEILIKAYLEGQDEKLIELIEILPIPQQDRETLYQVFNLKTLSIGEKVDGKPTDFHQILH